MLSNVLLRNSGLQLITGVNFADAAISGIKIGTTAPDGGSTSDDYCGGSCYGLIMNTATSWTAVGCLYTAGSNTNSFDRAVKSGSSATTFSGGGSSSSPFCIVIDLGQQRTFNHARYYQTFSDGKTTHAALDVSSSGNLETRTSTNWAQIHGFNALDDSGTSQGIGVNFAVTTARYIRLRIYNDGRYGSTGYTELFNFKLFATG